MTESFLNKIHEHSLNILKDTGIMIPDEKILSQLRDVGFIVDLESMRVRFPSEMIERALKTIHKPIFLFGRKSNIRIEFNQDTKFMPSGTGVGIIDALSNKRRESTSKDVENLIKIQNALEHVDIVRTMVTAMDYPCEYTDLIEFYYLFKYTTKPFFHRTLKPDNIPIVLEMAKIISGDLETFQKRPFFGVVYCPLSPLSFSPEAIQSILTYAKSGIPILILSMAMGGATAPATLFGELIVINAEILGTVTLIKSLYPNVALLYGSVSSVLDMKTGILALGAPERGILNLWCARMARYYGMPSVMGGLSTDARKLDVQAGFEKAITALPLMGEASVIFGMGVIDSANSYSYEQLILDNEWVGALKKIQKSLNIKEDQEEIELIKLIGPKGSYLGEIHTAKHCRDYWRSSLINRGFGDEMDLVLKANEIWNKILKNGISCEPLEDHTEQELTRLLQREIGLFSKG
jgi:trimethylamine--corrinoid protein Co-methyltransferase